jgi:hypothetical protein
MVARNVQVVLIALALLAAMAVVAVADGGDDAPPRVEADQITAIEPDAKEAMTVLEEPRVTADRLPADLAETIDERADFGMNPDLSRRAIGNASNSIYALPANDHVCAALTLGEGANLNCATTDQIAAGESGPATVVLATGDVAIYGLVPNGVEAVSVQTGTDVSTTVNTQDNAYYTVVQAGTPLRSVAFDGPSGRVDFPISDPAEVFGER